MLAENFPNLAKAPKLRDARIWENPKHKSKEIHTKTH